MSSPGGESRGGHASGRVALITGVTGQDGTCLAQLLLGKGYGVVGTTRNLAHAYPLCGDASKAQRLLGWKAGTQMDEIYRIMIEKDIAQLRAGGLA